jgi:hypothetical protein
MDFKHWLNSVALAVVDEGCAQAPRAGNGEHEDGDGDEADEDDGKEDEKGHDEDDDDDDANDDSGNSVAATDGDDGFESAPCERDRSRAAIC